MWATPWVLQVSGDSSGNFGRIAIEGRSLCDKRAGRESEALPRRSSTMGETSSIHYSHVGNAPNVIHRPVAKHHLVVEGAAIGKRKVKERNRQCRIKRRASDAVSSLVYVWILYLCWRASQKGRNRKFNESRLQSP